MSTEDLRHQYAGNGFHPLDALVEITYVWDGTGLRSVVGPDIEFDYAIASHVIEHVPDVIGWLNDILSVLKPGGIVALAVPDRRYTFDVRRPVTTMGQLLEHFLSKRRKPGPEQIFDHFSQVVKVSHIDIHGLVRRDLDIDALERHHTDEEALDLAMASLGPDAHYRDRHASVFTPKSFLELLAQMVGLGLLPAELAEFYSTEHVAIEFFATLRKADLDKDARKQESERIRCLAQTLTDERDDWRQIRQGVLAEQTQKKSRMRLFR